MSRSAGYAKGNLRKKVILDNAIELFGENGFAATSLRDVARQSGMTHSGLLHHYPSKDALLAAVLESLDTRAEEQKSSTQESEPDVGAVLVQLMMRDKEDPKTASLLTKLLAESITPLHPGHEYFLARFRRIHDSVVATLVDFQTRGEIRMDISVDQMAYMLGALADGLCLRWLSERGADGGPFDMVEVVRRFIGMIQIDHGSAPKLAFAQD